MFSQEDIEEFIPKVVMSNWFQCRHEILCKDGFQKNNGNRKVKCQFCHKVWTIDEQNRVVDHGGFRENSGRKLSCSCGSCKTCLARKRKQLSRKIKINA